MAFFGQLFDSKTSILGTLGGHFGTLWLHFGGLGHPRVPQRCPLVSEIDFSLIFGALGLPLGCHFGTVLGDFLCFLMLKVEIGLRTCFLRGFRVEK